MGWMSLLDDNDDVTGIVSDVPWDIMGVAIEEIIKYYKESVERPPTKHELEQIFSFVLDDDLLLNDVYAN